MGQIFSGSWKQILLAKRLGVPEALGLSLDEWVRERLGGYIRLAIEERREAVKALAAEGESTRSIAGVLGVGKDTVRNDLNGEKSPPTEKQTSIEEANTRKAVSRTAQPLPGCL